MYYEKADKAQNDAETAHFWRRLGDNRMLFVASIIQALGYELDGQPNAVLRLEREIFEGLHGTNREKPDDYFGMRDRDIFFDAVITGSSDSMIFSDEYITPHRNPLKNPVPIQILKVQPGVTFTFQFNLKDAYHTARIIGDAPRLLTSAQRLELFRQILMFFGAGAKTNSGFGHFESDGQVDLSGKSRLPKDEDSIVVAPILIGQKKEDRMQEIPLERVKKGNPVYAEVIKRNGNILYFRLFVSGYSKEAQCMYHADNIQSGQFVQLLVRDVGGKGDNRKIVVAEPCLIF
jgi:CRISPR type III-B/RAMP module RAMP protein Cmr6